MDEKNVSQNPIALHMRTPLSSNSVKPTENHFSLFPSLFKKHVMLERAGEILPSMEKNSPMYKMKALFVLQDIGVS